jgi:outer membrane receptor protein involved in Fe transport
MREMFSTGLGKFHPNPNLNSETQNLADAGLSMRGERSELWIGAFASFLEGGVEKVPYGGEGARFQRVNRDEIRVLGLEFMLGWRPLPGVHLGLQHSQFDAWAREVGGDELSAEDRPDYLSRFSLAWTRAGGLRLRLEAAMTGPRFSAHPEDGLTRLPSEGSASLRVGHILRLETWMPGSDIEVYLRIDNLFDSIRLSQVGLPEAGRSLQAGCNLALRG